MTQVDTAIIVNGNPPLAISGLIETEITTENKYETYNRQHSVSIPLTLGFYKSYGNHGLMATAGAAINIWSINTGYTRSPTNTIQKYKTLNPTEYLTKTSTDIIFGLHYTRQLDRSISLMMGGNYRATVTPSYRMTDIDGAVFEKKKEWIKM